MASLAPLAMSQTKDELLGYLDMGTETYTMMAENCRRKPPYDWSDINEKSKDEAMKLISKSGDAQTSYYWYLAGPSPDECPNWIAKWFLYHKFRYRDGRNRNPPSNGDSGKGPFQHSSHHQHSASASSSASSAYYDIQTHDSMTSGGLSPLTSASLSPRSADRKIEKYREVSHCRYWR
ncbi:hypothetical protein LARI1_G005768 [Lachnellula arida]|uniref:Uncharacterized protein n=1 Tax=Lachnellula arida TaxID=1316785 RepID=A0A8T9BB49_9HELO|nr:hypothetical protein LARI1_G005768 [Lachnellula arida]